MDAPCTGVECAKMEVLLTPQQGTPMSEITVIGLDLAKHVFQVHGADPDGRPVLRRRLRRGQVLEFFATLSPCLIGMEARRRVRRYRYSESRMLSQQLGIVSAGSKPRDLFRHAWKI